MSEIDSGHSGPVSDLTTNSGSPDFPGTAARCHHDS
jgi:hypothetical protein